MSTINCFLGILNLFSQLFCYFYAAGASKNFGEDHDPETHLIPNVLRAAVEAKIPVSIFGLDYPTRDGSCIRDYIHVEDIAQAHINALERIEKLDGRAYNLGNDGGYSVLEVVKTASHVCTMQIPTVISPRRERDPSELTASSEKDLSELEVLN